MRRPAAQPSPGAPSKPSSSSSSSSAVWDNKGGQPGTGRPGVRLVPGAVTSAFRAIHRAAAAAVQGCSLGALRAGGRAGGAGGQAAGPTTFFRFFCPLGPLGLAASRSARLAACSAACARMAAACGFRAASGKGGGHRGPARAGTSARALVRRAWLEPSRLREGWLVRTCGDDGQPRGGDARRLALQGELQGIPRLQAQHPEHALGLAALRGRAGGGRRLGRAARTAQQVAPSHGTQWTAGCWRQGTAAPPARSTRP